VAFAGGLASETKVCIEASWLVLPPGPTDPSVDSGVAEAASAKPASFGPEQPGGARASAWHAKKG